MVTLGFILLILGALITCISAVGFTKFSGFFSKSHAAGVNDVFGCLLALLGCVIMSGLSLSCLKVVILIIIILISSPTSTYVLSMMNLEREKRK
ncbi:MAG: monovalent cation/H(+) antiporter subunit G [Rickettsiales bacterium]